MTKLKEEKELHSINEEFSTALALFHAKKYEQAEKSFQQVTEIYKDSDSYSVQEIQTRAKVYARIAHAQLNPIKLILESKEDHINEAIYRINCGESEQALEVLQAIASQMDKDPFFHFISAIAYQHEGLPEKVLQHLELCIKLDPSYRVKAYNEPDFELLQQNPEFQSIFE